MIRTGRTARIIEGTMFGVIFNVALALVSAGALVYGLVTGREALTVLGAFALGGWAARLRWGPRS
jgi:hypothetical protein